MVIQRRHQPPLTADRVAHWQQQRPQQLFGRDRGPANLGLQAVQWRRQLFEHGLNQGPDGTPGMVGGHARFWRERTQHGGLLLVVSAHGLLLRDRVPVSSAACYRMSDLARDPKWTFSAAC
jgi:hypothetical protein